MGALAWIFVGLCIGVPFGWVTRHGLREGQKELDRVSRPVDQDAELGGAVKLLDGEEE